MDKVIMENVTDILPKNTIMWIMVISSVILTILFLLVSYLGVRKKWYINLPVKINANTWTIAALWIVASIISYGVFYFIRGKDEKIYGQSRIYPYFLIISYLNLLWAVIFFNNENFSLTLGIIAIIFALQFYLIIFLAYISVIAALLLVPLLLLYGYLFYTTLHLASVNNIII